MTKIAHLAIVTKYLPPTDKLGSRVRASCPAGALTSRWNHDFSIQRNHELAALALAKQLGWHFKDYHVGGLEKGRFVVVLDRVTPGAPE